jgi:flagellar assembly protein FliH
LYKDPVTFVPDQLSKRRSGAVEEFALDDFVRKAQALKSEFIQDLEQQRIKEGANILQPREGVDEIFSDAMQKMKDQAEQAEEEACQRGYQEGHEKGYQEGAREIRERFESSLETLKNLIDELSASRSTLYPRLEREMVEMVTTLARKVVHAELKGKDNAIRDIVRMAVESALNRQSLVIKVHPDDYSQLQDYGQELIQLFHDIKNVSFETFSSVPIGNCVVETNFGTVEAGLNHLDEHIAKILHLAPPAPEPPTLPDISPEPVEPEASEETLESNAAPDLAEPTGSEETQDTNDPDVMFDLEDPDITVELDDPVEFVEPIETNDMPDVEEPMDLEETEETELRDVTLDLDDPDIIVELDDPEEFAESLEADEPVDQEDPDEPFDLEDLDEPEAST